MKECLSRLQKWLKSPDSSGLTKVTIARNGQIFEKVHEGKSIRSLENLLDVNLIRDIWNQKLEDKEWEKATAGTYL